MSKQRQSMLVSTVVVLRRDDKICVLKRGNTKFYAGYYALPGGGVDGDEPTSVATAREAMEELGVTVAPQDLDLVHVIHIKRDNGVEFICFYMQATHFEGQPRIMEPDKCESVAWVTLDALPELMIPTHQYALDMMKKGLMYSEYGW